jgi:hypothetical protein
MPNDASRAASPTAFAYAFAAPGGAPAIAVRSDYPIEP